MTMNELVAYIAEEISLTSPESRARIGRALNVRYKQVTSAIGMIPTRREVVTKLATIGSQFLTFSGIEKLDVVYRKVGTKNYILDELTNDEMLDTTPRDEPPLSYSIFSVAPSSVTIKMDCVPTTAFMLYTEGLADATTLTGTDSPAFPESFHDVLIHGVCADEYRRKEKPALAKDSAEKYEARLSDLKMFIAKSAYLEIYRGKHRPSEGWWDTSGGK